MGRRLSLSAETNGVSRVKRLEAKIRDPSNERAKAKVTCVLCTRTLGGAGVSLSGAVSL